MVEHGQSVQVRFAGKMLKKMQVCFVAAAFKLLHLLLGVTIWSCHAWVAPAFRFCRGSAALISGLTRQGIDTGRMAEIISQAKACRHLSLPGVKRRSNLKKNEIATPPGLAMMSQESDRVCINHSKLFQLRLKATRIASIPKIWSHGVKQPMGQGETPNPELRTPNFKGFTLIELIVVMVVIGILAATLLPLIDFGATSSTSSVDGAAYMVASDIRYAQECAMATRTSKTITFSAGANSYSFALTPNKLDPTGQLPSGVTTSALTLTFNSLGEPTVGGGSSVAVSAGGVSRTITVTQYTGKVSIP